MSIVWKTGENRKQWLRKNPKKKKDHWVEYHATRLNLIESIDSHFKSISKVNVYNSGSRTDIRLNTSGDSPACKHYPGARLQINSMKH